MMKVLTGVTLVLIILGVMLSTIIHPVYAQEPDPTPTPTATPALSFTIPLSSGNVVQIERTFTYGDIALALVGMALAGIGLLYGLMRLVSLWLR